MVTVIGMSVMSLAANAAQVTFTFTGAWNANNTWNPGQTGAPTMSANAEGGPEMQVAGEITFDDQSGAVSGLTMNQVGILTSNWDLNPDVPNTPEYDPVTMSGYAWHSEGTDLRLDTGLSVCEGVDNTACGPGFQFGGQYMGRGGPLENFGPPYSLADFIGADNLDAYGDILNGPGFTGLVTGNTAVIDALTGWDGFVALAATARFDLQLGTQVPVPAAAWLFGSALGLLGWVRRRCS
ncbi:MAG: VPLPA-CTERM sorting domain-containing protein [Gammaproteobacteria bacterium]